MLIERGASPGAATTTGNTALLLACERGHLDTMKLIMAGGADIEESNAQGFRRVVPWVDDVCRAPVPGEELFLDIDHCSVSHILPGVASSCGTTFGYTQQLHEILAPLGISRGEQEVHVSVTRAEDEEPHAAACHPAHNASPANGHPLRAEPQHSSKEENSGFSHPRRIAKAAAV